MPQATPEFSLRVDGVEGLCPAGEAWSEDQIANNRVPVLSCEGPCIRGDIARLAADRVASEEPFARACWGEVTVVPHSGFARWVKGADHVVVIDGCFLKCMGRIVNNIIDQKKITHFDTHPLYNKWNDLFYMYDVPEAERRETAQKVAEKMLPELRAAVT